MVRASFVLLGIPALVLGLSPNVIAQVTKADASPQYRLWEFDEAPASCRAKGRLQDKGYCVSKMMDDIVIQGKSSIPYLISQLTDERRTKEPVYDYWSYTTAGDVAYFILRDLFTDSDWTTFNMPGLQALNEKCDESAEVCWRRFLKQHGRRFVQREWLAAWNASKDRVYWNEQCRCFRLNPKSK